MSANQADRKSKVIIAGAGIGGLATALSLLNRGIDCDVYEQAPVLREVGAGLWMSMNGARVLTGLGLDVIKNVDSLHKWGLFVREPLKQWSAGRVTLLGDACHSMVPYLGQGVNMAIEDACVIARCLAENPNDPEVAFLTYQNARLDRTSKVVCASAAMQATFHHESLNEAKAAGEYIQTQWSPEANADRYNWIHQYDATTVPLH